jgi:uncharacterized protein (UPF0332 family)
LTDKETLLSYRIKQAEETLADAEAMAERRLTPRSIVNRAYYVIFYAVMGLFLKSSIALKTSKHSGVISMFDQLFVRTGTIEKQYSKAFHKAFNARQIADYKELVEVTPEEAEEAIRSARKFLTEIKRVISEQ